MATIHESIKFQTEEGSSVIIEIKERDKGEVTSPYRNLEIITDTFGGDFTHKELIKLGRLLIIEGKRIGREYTSKGRPRNRTEYHFIEKGIEI